MIKQRRDPREFVDTWSTLTKRLRAMIGASYGQLEMGTGQAKLLRYLGNHSPISQAELARSTDTAPTLIGRGISTLVDRGWIRRRRSDEDRREFLLELTASGQRMRQKVEDARGEVVTRISDVLDDRDLEDFARIAKKLLEAFPAQTQRG